MLIVLLSRCVPLISFDAVSYLAGLTSLWTWRFALATFLGVMQVGIAFAAMVHGKSAGGPGLSIWIACSITLLLLLVKGLRRLIRGRRVALSAPPRLARGALRA